MLCVVLVCVAGMFGIHDIGFTCTSISELWVNVTLHSRVVTFNANQENTYVFLLCFFILFIFCPVVCG